MRIRSHLLLLTAVVLIPGFLAAAIAVEKVREGERQAALMGLRETVRSTSLLVDGELRRSLGALTALSTSEHLGTGDLKAFYEQATAINQPPDVWTLLLDDQGQQVLNTVLPFGAPLPSSPAAKERVAKVLATQRPLVTDLIVGPVTGKLIITVYLPARAWQGKQYVVAQAFSVDHWKKSVTQPRGRADWVVAVIDHSGRFISRSKNANALLGKQARPELVAAAAVSREGLIRHNTLEGIESYDAFTHSDLSGWTFAVAAPVKSIEASATQAVAWLTAGVIMALAGAMVTALVLTRKFILAMDTASTAARSLGAGHLPVTPRTSLTEVDALNHALSEAGRVLAADREARAALEAERKRLLDSETAAREEAQAQNAAKDQFLALLGHELRNPLSAIAGATAILMRSGTATIDRARYLGMIQRQNKHLTHIVNDLLDISRMLSGKIVLEREPLNLATCVLHCVEALKTTDRGVGHPFTVDAEEAWIDGDAVRIEQVLSNLLSNALKYSEPVGELRVSVRAGVQEASVEVRDFGLGISPDLLPHVFEPFVQGPAMPGTLQSGLGIGLALVRQLVALHGGQVSVSSHGVGMGSAFLVTLPLIPAPLAPSVEVSGEQSRLVGKVLLVEDNLDNMEATSALIRLLGHEVIEAHDGEQALVVAASNPPDVIVMDLGLPGKDGYQVATELKQIAHLKHIPLIALTGYGHQRSSTQASSALFNAYLVKPVDPELLGQTIRAQLSRG